jgi:DNA-binding IclR family transcriptional regulator
MLNQASPAKPGSSDAEPTRERGGVQSLVRAFSILGEIAERPEGLSLAELSRIVRLHNSTTFHLVRTMVSLGYIRQDPRTKRYHIGRMVFSLAASSRSDIDLLGLATPILDELAQRSGETTHMAILTGNEVTVVAKSAGSGAFQLQERRGGIRPAHATALGKVLLAACSPGEIEHYLSSHGLPALTERTITDSDRLYRELDNVRAAGVAFDDGEFNAEVRCLAVPVYDFTGAVVAALGVSGPIWRVTLRSLEEMQVVARVAAMKLSEELGGAKPANAG